MTAVIKAQMKAGYKISLMVLTAATLALGACSSTNVKKEEPYVAPAPQTRQLPPDPVYSRLTWSHLPQPTPLKARGNGRARMLSPTMHLELKNVTLKEAIYSLAQTIGYQATVPDEVADKLVSVNSQGTPERLLSDISSMAGVRAELDKLNRTISVYAPHKPDYQAGQNGMVNWQ